MTDSTGARSPFGKNTGTGSGSRSCGTSRCAAMPRRWSISPIGRAVRMGAKISGWHPTHSARLVYIGGPSARAPRARRVTWPWAVSTATTCRDIGAGCAAPAKRVISSRYWRPSGAIRVWGTVPHAGSVVTGHGTSVTTSFRPRGIEVIAAGAHGGRFFTGRLRRIREVAANSRLSAAATFIDRTNEIARGVEDRQYGHGVSPDLIDDDVGQRRHGQLARLRQSPGMADMGIVAEPARSGGDGAIDLFRGARIIAGDIIDDVVEIARGGLGEDQTHSARPAVFRCDSRENVFGRYDAPFTRRGDAVGDPFDLPGVRRQILFERLHDDVVARTIHRCGQRVDIGDYILGRAYRDRFACAVLCHGSLL